MQSVQTLLLIFVANAVFQSAAAALSLADFTKCIGRQGQGPVCQLDPGTYPISSALLIGRPNITIQGGTANAADTILQRAPGSTDAIMRSPFVGLAANLAWPLRSRSAA